MRIIGGELKGIRFSIPKKFPSRATTDMAKEALFGILDAKMYFENLDVLDLFSGTGNISMEFLSRGVGKVISVDNHPVSVKFQFKQREKLNLLDWQIHRQDAIHFLETAGFPQDVIFADPPFDFDQYEELVRLIFENGWLAEDGVVIIEHSERKSLAHVPHINRTRKYGGVHFSFFEP